MEQRRLNDREISWLGGRRLVPRETHPRVFEKFGGSCALKAKVWMFHVEHFFDGLCAGGVSRGTLRDQKRSGQFKCVVLAVADVSRGTFPKDRQAL